MTLKFETDVVIVGGGLAGMTAAQAARSQGARVTIVDRTGLGLATNTALSNGVFAGPTAQYDLERYVDDTLRIGRSLGRPWMVRQVATDLSGAIDRLRGLGLEMAEKKDYFFVVTGGGDEFPGARLARTLARRLSADDGIVRMGGTWVDRILTGADRAVGVHGFNRDGRAVAVHAGAVVLAAGGAGALYLRNDNQKSTLGQGYALAADAGLALWDMEFVQYYPVVMAQAHLPAMMLNSPHPEGSRILTADGRDLADAYGIENINDAIRNRRDWLSAVLFKECQKGPVCMDYRAVADPHWDRHPLVLLKKRRFDFRSQPVAISPAAHYMMGGVRIDAHGATDLAGLFACGEMAWGLHGACRKGGNALAECLVFGQLAGLNAAGALGAHVRPSGLPDEMPSMSPSPAPDGPILRELRRNLQTVAWQHAGVVRTAAGLEAGLGALDGIMPRIRVLPARTPDRGRTRADLLSMATVLRAILAASYARLESRGCFIRSDYPEEDNARWLKNSCVDGAAGLERPVVSHFSAEVTSVA
jgi:aspartate oxidase